MSTIEKIVQKILEIDIRDVLAGSVISAFLWLVYNNPVQLSAEFTGGVIMAVILYFFTRVKKNNGST